MKQREKNLTQTIFVCVVEVIVTTSAVLSMLLEQTFIRIEELSLVIFDEFLQIKGLN